MPTSLLEAFQPVLPNLFYCTWRETMRKRRLSKFERLLSVMKQPLSPTAAVIVMAQTIKARIVFSPRPEAAAVRECVAEVLAELTFREERILRMRFGIGMPDRTLKQVGKAFGVTHERIRQIEAKALQKLSHSARARKLLTFTER